jgi:hypothetical protein
MPKAAWRSFLTSRRSPTHALFIGFTLRVPLDTSGLQVMSMWGSVGRLCQPPGEGAACPICRSFNSALVDLRI